MTWEVTDSTHVTFVLMNLSNLACNASNSMMSPFLPQAARERGMSEDLVGVTFALSPFVTFALSPFAGQWIPAVGKRRMYVVGLLAIALATSLFALASLFSGTRFTMFCFALRLLHGFGMAFEETAIYALVAELDPERISENCGICEFSSGLGFMIGPVLGGFLYAYGSFQTPFLTIGLLLV